MPATSALFASEAPGLSQYLDETFRRIVVKQGDRMHDIVDDIIASSKLTSGKGKMKSTGGGSSGGQHWERDPALEPKRSSVKPGSLCVPVSRSRIEPLEERQAKASSVGRLFDAAAEECREAFNSVVKECRKQKKKFFDQDFYYDRRESMYPPGTPDDCTVAEPREAVRMSELYPRAELFADEISSNDMTQGSVGNCFFVGAIGALAAHSRDSLRRLFVAHDSDAGVYGVCFFKNGSWEWVLVDDFIAVQTDRSGNQFPLYASSGQGGNIELWPLVLEKAYAKMHLNWDTIDGGWAREALVDLTGGLEASYDLAERNAGMTFKVFRRDVEDPHVVLTCAVGEHVEAGEGMGHAGEAGAVFGLFHGHQYSVIGASEAPDGTCFVQVRNPWGNDAEWKGRYCDDDDAWRENPQHYKHVKPNFGNDGCFWMLWEDFKQYFTDIDVVRKFPADFRALTIPFRGQRVPSPDNTFALRVFHAPVKLTVVFSQEDPKVSPDHDKQKNAAYRPMSVVVAGFDALPDDISQLEDVPHRVVANITGRQRAISAEVELQPGVYCVNATMKTKQKNRSVFLRLFGPPNSTYAVRRWNDAECTLGVGDWQTPLESVVKAESAIIEARAEVPNMYADPTVTLSPSATVAPAKPVSPAAKPVAAAAAEPAEQRRGGDKQYIEQLENLVADLQAQLAEAKASARTVPASRASSAARGAGTTPLQRLGMDRASFRASAKQVFSELANEHEVMDLATAVNGLRLVVTLGAGMDDEFIRVHKQLYGENDDITLDEFVNVCDGCVQQWAPLQP